MNYRQQSFPMPAAALVAAACCFSPTHGQMVQGPNPVPRETVIPGGSVEVPMQRYRQLSILEAYINDQGPFRFVVDTGAPVLIVNKSLAAKLKLPAPERLGGAEIIVAGPGGQGIPASFHEVDSLRIGRAEFRKIETLAIDSPLGLDFDGVIGIGVFHDCLLTYDYPAGKFRMSEEQLPAANGRDVLDFTHGTHRSAPVIPIALNGQSHQFVIDTGASTWFIFSKAATDGCSYAQGPVKGPRAKTVDREIETQVARLKGELAVGEHVFKEPYGAVEDPMRLSLMGNQALENFVFSLDQRNKRLRLTRTAKGPIIPPPYRVVGFGLKKEAAGLVVSDVMDGSPAMQAGLALGDRIVSIENQPAAGVYGHPIWNEMLKRDSIGIRYIPAGSSEARDLQLGVMVLVP